MFLKDDDKGFSTKQLILFFTNQVTCEICKAVGVQTNAQENKQLS